MTQSSHDARSTPADGSPRVEVVADQTQDGAYEIRLERTQPMPPMDGAGTGTRLSAVESAARPKSTGARRPAIAVAVVGVAAAVGVGVAMSSTGDGGGGRTPELDAPEEVDGFRSFVLEPQTVRTLSPRVLAIDVGGGPEPDVEEAPPEAQPPQRREASRVEPFEGARLVEPAALTPAAPTIRGVDRLRAVPVDPDLLLANPSGDDEAYAGDEVDEEYGDEYADEYDDEYADDEYGDEYE